MKIYRVKVNGKLYEVELESVSEVASSVSPAPQKTPSQSQKVEVNSQGVELKAPMQGTILDIKASEGQHVNKGQILFVLEAMKLENDIVSPKTGFIKQILVSKNQAVNNQEVLAIIE